MEQGMFAKWDILGQFTKMKTSEHDTRKQLRLPEDLNEAIDKAAKELNINSSEFIREACQEKIEKILGLKVNIINKKNNSGKILIEYKNLEQFELLSALLTKN